MKSVIKIIFELKKEGMNQTKIGKIVGLSQGRVSMLIKGGEEGELKKRGRKEGYGIKKEEEAKLKELIERGAKAYGYEEERWTSARLSQVMKEQIGVKKGATTIRRWLNKLGISYQKVATKDSRQDEKAVKKWQEVDVASEKKS